MAWTDDFEIDLPKPNQEKSVIHLRTKDETLAKVKEKLNIYFTDEVKKVINDYLENETLQNMLGYNKQNGRAFIEKSIFPLSIENLPPMKYIQKHLQDAGWDAKYVAADDEPCYVTVQLPID
jgi:hypothetical protein